MPLSYAERESLQFFKSYIKATLCHRESAQRSSTPGFQGLAPIQNFFKKRKLGEGERTRKGRGAGSEFVPVN